VKRALWALMVVAVVVPPAATQETPGPAGIDRPIEQGLTSWQVPGLALAGVRDGNVSLAKG